MPLNWREKQQWISFLKPLIGSGLCALSSLIFTLANAMVKHLRHVDPFMIACIRFYIITLMSSPVMMNRINIETPFPKDKRWLLFLRGLLGATNLTINYYGIQVCNYGKSILKSTSPL